MRSQAKQHDWSGEKDEEHKLIPKISSVRFQKKQEMTGKSTRKQREKAEIIWVSSPRPLTCPLRYAINASR
jgi:hypothetical protein